MKHANRYFSFTSENKFFQYFKVSGPIDLGSFFFVQKPSGIATHSVDQNKFGFVEWLESRLGHSLFTVQRLDKETSGIMIFADSAKGADALNEIWNSHHVSKKYLALVKNSKSLPDHFEVESEIDKKEKHYVSDKNKTPNSHSKFKVLKRSNTYALIQAEIFSGKTHQIRLHLAGEGFPVLGDSLYDPKGVFFHRLALHAENLKIENAIFETTILEGQSDAPEYFYHPELLEDPFYFSTLSAIESAIKNRRWTQGDLMDSQRLVHLEQGPLRLDLFHKTLWLYDYNNEALSDEDQQKIFQFLQKKIPKLTGLISRHMQDRGKNNIQGDVEAFGLTENRWLISEGTSLQDLMTLEIRSDCGLSPGLFLDQRANRRFIRSQAKNKTVLNLFSFTAGFSVAAALGGAERVVTVDTSAVYNEWAKQNFRLNELDDRNHEFWTTDCMLFLKGCNKKQRKFDLIVCDPPSLGRSKEGVFKLESEWKKIFEDCASLLTSKGLFLFSHNLEKWDNQEWIKIATSEAQKYQLELAPFILPDLDYEVDFNRSNMKSLVFVKK